MLMATKHAEVGTWALNITILDISSSSLSLTSPSIDFVILIIVETYIPLESLGLGQGGPARTPNLPTEDSFKMLNCHFHLFLYQLLQKS